MEKLESKRRIIMNLNWELPSNIVKVIFSKLPFSNLPTCRLVCKTWNDLVLDYASSSKFLPNAFLLCTFDVVPNSSLSDVRTDTHWRNPKLRCIEIDTMSCVASFSFEDNWSTVIILNSCNGLLYITKENFDVGCDGILNPATNEFFKLFEREEDIYAFGFGFSPKTKQYKLFRFTPTNREWRKCNTTMEICRISGSDNQLQWTHLGCQPFKVYSKGAYLDGVVYWIVKEIGNEFVIYGLNVETEKIESITILDVTTYSTDHYASLQPFNGTIYATIIMHAPFWKIYMWKMRAKDSWIRSKFVIHFPNDLKSPFFYLIKAFEDEGQIWFLLDLDLFCMDKTDRMIKIKTLIDRNETSTGGISHIESLNFSSLSNILARDIETPC